MRRKRTVNERTAPADAYRLALACLLIIQGSSKVGLGEETGNVIATRISGRVTDGGGRAIAGARVAIWHNDDREPAGLGEDRSKLIIAETETGPDGRYAVTVEVPEEDSCKSISAAFVAKGYGVHEEWLRHASSLPPVLRLPDVRLGPGEEMAGTVLDHGGKPVPGLVVCAGPSRSPYHGPINWSGGMFLAAKTDARGKFCIRGLSRSSMDWWTLRRTDGRILLRWFRWHGATSLRLPRLGSIEGRVVSRATGKPVAGAEIQCRESRECLRYQMSYQARTDDDGRFQIPEVAPSEYELRANGSRAHGFVANVRVHSGERVLCDIQARDATDIHGQIVFGDSGRPAPGRTIYVHALGFRKSLVWGTSLHADRQGRFGILGLPPGIWEIYPLPKGVRRLDLRTRAGRRDVRIELCGSGWDTFCEGAVRDADGRPAAGAWVQGGARPFLLFGADGAGRYQLRIPRGRMPTDEPWPFLALSADRSSCGTGEIPSDWTPGQAIDVRLDRPATQIQGRVVDTEGAPLAGARVSAGMGHVRRLDNPLSSVAPATLTAEDGTFELKPLDPMARYSVTVRLPSYAVKVVPVTPGEKFPDIVLPRADAVIRGRTTDENGNPLADISIRGSWPGGYATTFTDSKGMFTLEGLVADKRASLLACGVDYGPLWKSDVSISSEPVNIRFPGPAGKAISGQVLDREGRLVQGGQVYIKGDYCNRWFICDTEGYFNYTRCLGGTYHLEATMGAGEQALSVWDVPAGKDDVRMRFPSEAESGAIRRERDARAGRVHPLGTRISMAKHAYLTNPTNVGPLPVRHGYWMVRSIKYAGLKIRTAHAGKHQISLRARRVCKDAVPLLRVPAGKQSFSVALSSYEWQECGQAVELPAGEHRLGFQLERGWAADIDWIEVRAE